MTGLTAVALLLGAQGALHAAPLALSTKPLFLKTGVAPNLIITLDDSGSMRRDYMPDNRSGNRNERFYSSDYNGVAYNPEVAYDPPLHADGTPFSTTFHNAYTSPFTNTCSDGRRGCGPAKDLSVDYITRDLWGSNQTWPAFYAKFTSSNLLSLVPLTVLCDILTDLDQNVCYNRVTVSATSGPSGSDERQNFANWYSFYRDRNLTTITGASRAFYPLGNDIRVGWQRLNTSTTIKPVRFFTSTHRTAFYNWLFDLPHSGGTPLRRALQRAGVYFKTNQPYYNNAVDSGDGSASCRQNYQVLMTDGLWNGGLSNGPGNYDNSEQTLPDGTSYNPQAPFQDDNSNVLADLAFKYWAEDLSTLANDVPPYMLQQGASASANYWNAQNDPANWQHLVNFTVGLGLGASLTDPVWGGSTFTGDYPNLADGSKNWPAITSNTPSTVSDLWHAAINSRGQFFSADDPKALAAAFKTILNRVADRTSSGTSVAIESGAITHSDNVYIARFNSRDWTGQVVAHALSHDPVTLGDIGAAVWDAACALTGGACTTDGNTYTGRTAANRQIVTYNPATGTGVPFQWADLNSSQTTFLNRASDGTVDSEGEARLHYLRGDRSQEQSNGGGFRDRKGLLGDVVDATPIYVGPPDRFYPDDWDDARTTGNDNTAEDQVTGTYADFKAAHDSRAGVVYVGANDGMLHAFAAATGAELFAYVPSAVYDHLSDLTDPAYGHRFYVDATPTEGDAFFGGAWHTILVGGLRAGGQGVYALDITTVPGASAGEASVAAKVLWEFTDADDADLGATYGQPQIVRLHNGHWAAVFGNGYNNTDNDGKASSTGNAVLFIRDLESGTVIKLDTHRGTADDPTGNARPNGLATVTSADVDGDSIVDYLYAGDLFGNLWKFDVKAGNTSNWKIAYGSSSNPTPLFTAVDANGTHEPITTAPSIRRHPTGEGFLLMFGTGKYLENQDSALSTKMQSAYGIWDRDGSSLKAFTRSNLLEQTIEQATTVNGTDFRIMSDHSLTWADSDPTTLPSSSSDGYLGWYMDLLAGEMQVTDSLVRGNRLIFTTLIPNDDPCSLGGDSWLMVLDYRDGGRFNLPVFDTDNNGVFALADLVEVDVDGDGNKEKISVGGQKSKSGILQTPTLGSMADADRAYLGGSDGKGTDCAGQDCTDIGRDPATRNRQSWLQLR
ncbi:type 4 fimbrial biogenesis protein PilY1 [Nitrococcus mobilis Nb-231]|uniref:Type 4 fimbrial biogenesis protein PilY1 n=2 Tax=Nitrococcus mobilis TaxID=35797 RepID=A4BTT7_9GAMM|nr:type 4 fimbrial biogenesis protein PilY1 [Nitrococcus mobilis Nb-231]